MIFNDVVEPTDTIKAVLDKDCVLYGDLVEIEIQGADAECVWLTKDDAKALGEHLIALSKEII